MNTGEVAKRSNATGSEPVTEGSNPSLPATRSLTVEEMFAIVRRRSKTTKGAFKGDLRRAIKLGYIERHGRNLLLAAAGEKFMLDIYGAVAQLGEQDPCKVEAAGSSPACSTSSEA